VAAPAIMHTATFRLRPKPPFDFDAAVRFLMSGGYGAQQRHDSSGHVMSFPATAGEQFSCAGQLVKAFREDGLTVVVRLVSNGTVEQPELVGDVVAERPVTSRALDRTADRVGFWLSVDDDLTDFYKRADDAFAELAEQMHGYHQVKFPSPLEILCWAILVQRTPLAAAQAMKAGLLAQFGGDLRLPGMQVTAFPDLDQLRSLSRRRLEQAIGSPSKAARLEGAVAAFAQADEEFLRTGDFADVKRFLLGIPGIGPRSASFVLVRGLGRTDELAPDDEMTAAARQVYGVDLDPDELSALAEPYGQWRGYWAHYMRVAAA
jgi:DNA-3-methyladenine glycosylase II